MTSRPRGVTLLEMMVVMLIAAMAITLGFQSLTQWQRAEESLDRAGGVTRESVLTESWWRESVRGIHARHDARLTGDTTRFSGNTSMPVLSPSGVATESTWQLGKHGANHWLTLSEGGLTLQLTLPDAEQAAFRYMDRDGSLHEVWPPRLGEQASFPTAIALVQVGANGYQRVWLAPIIGEPRPHHPAFEMEEY